MSDIAESTAKWNGFGHFEKTLLCSISAKSGSNLASKYQDVFSLKFSLLDRVEKDLMMKAVIANSFEGGIGHGQQVQEDKLTSFTQSNERDTTQQQVRIDNKYTPHYHQRSLEFVIFQFSISYTYILHICVLLGCHIW
jgi:hypothetical protein